MIINNIEIRQSSQYFCLPPNGLVSYVKIFLFCGSVAIGLFTHNAMACFLGFLLLVLWDRRFTLSVMLITPLIETILIVYTGMSITKMLVVVFIFLFLIELLASDGFRFDITTFVLFAYVIIISTGLINGLLTGKYFASTIWDGNILGEFLILQIPKIAFACILYCYLQFKGVKFFLQNLHVAVFSLSIALIVTSWYFSTTGNTQFSWYTITRFLFLNADPNEFAGIIAALSVFPLFLCLSTDSTTFFWGGAISFLSVVYSVFLTLSRSGFFSLLVVLIITLMIFFRQNKTRASLFVFLILILISFAYGYGLIDFIPLYERLLGTHVQDVSSLTEGRLDLLKAGITASKERLFIGYGGTQFASEWINFNLLGRFKVMHNLYLEILIQYGILGIFFFFVIIFQAFKGFLVLKKRNFKNRDELLLFIPFIALAALLFSGLALSWQWREIVWYFIGLSLATSYFTKKLRYSNHEKRVIIS